MTAMKNTQANYLDIVFGCYLPDIQNMLFCNKFQNCDNLDM